MKTKEITGGSLVLTLNKEEHFPNGSWLGDPKVGTPFLYDTDTLCSVLATTFLSFDLFLFNLWVTNPYVFLP